MGSCNSSYFILVPAILKVNESDIVLPSMIQLDQWPDFIAQKIVYYIIAGLGILGNSVAMYVLAYMVGSGHKNTNILLINQSLIDLVASILLVLCFLVPQPSMTTAPTGWFVCFVWNSKYLFWATTMTSTVNLLYLTFERYYAVIYPIKYRERTWMMWPWSALLVLFPWFWGLIYEVHILVMNCFIDGVCQRRHFNNQSIRIAFAASHLTLKYLVPLALMVFAYVRIYQAICEKAAGNISNDRTPLIRNRQLSDNNKQARRNIIKTLLLVCTTFAVLWLPHQVLYTFSIIKGLNHSDMALYKVFTCIAFLNMCANPFIYTLQYQGFRQGLLQAIPCLKKFQTTPNAVTQEES